MSSKGSNQARKHGPHAYSPGGETSDGSKGRTGSVASRWAYGFIWPTGQRQYLRLWPLRVEGAELYHGTPALPGPMAPPTSDLHATGESWVSVRAATCLELMPLTHTSG